MAIRHQLLRFLSTPDNRGGRLMQWAQAELARVGPIVEKADETVRQAGERLLYARNAEEITAAERELSRATQARARLNEPPKKPKIAAEALRAWMVEDVNLDGLDMANQNLTGIHLTYRSLRGANFESATLSGTLQGSDLRGASFVDAEITGMSFFDADLRGADFRGARVSDSHFRRAHLEGADLSGAIFGNGVAIQATYDETTKWPVDFDPVAHGAVSTSAANDLSAQLGGDCNGESAEEPPIRLPDRASMGET